MSLIFISTLIITFVSDIVTSTDAPKDLFLDVACENLEKLQVGTICYHNSYHIRLTELKGKGTFARVWKVLLLSPQNADSEKYVKLDDLYRDEELYIFHENININFT